MWDSARNAECRAPFVFCTTEEIETTGKSGKEKDIAEKTLEAYNDVFADIVNGLLFKGEQVIREEALSEAQPFSMYKMDGGLHEQDRDVAKFWNEAGTDRVNVRIAFLGIENQTDYDKDMPMRVIGYDGAVYRAELVEKNRYPVITLVLYFGDKPWGRNRSLYDMFRVPENLAPYVSDYRINVFEIAFLTPEQVKCFHSDFRVVADYFSGKRRDPDYRPTDPVKFKHVDELLNLMAAITRDNRFEDWLQEGEEKTGDMDAFLDRVEEKGRQKGIAQGFSQGISQGQFQALSTLVRKNKLSVEDAAEEVGMTVEAFKEKMRVLL